ncbi:MAG: hypothetical protein JSS78_04480 [Bacteroidetes bacterium]|nr:hypothetical protein [Bacteroidota bacterium]
MLKGVMKFLPKQTPPQLELDDKVLFLAGIYLDSGFLVAYAAFNIEEIGKIVYFSGLRRLYSRINGVQQEYILMLLCILK